MTSYTHTTTILRVQTRDDEYWFDDTEGGMIEAMRKFNDELEGVKSRNPYWSGWEELQLARVRAGTPSDDCEVLECVHDDEVCVDHSKTKNEPCVWYWKTNPEMKWERDDCTRCYH